MLLPADFEGGGPGGEAPQLSQQPEHMCLGGMSDLEAVGIEACG